VLVLSVGAAWHFRSESYTAQDLSPHPVPTRVSFVGSDACATCHQAEARLWRGSQHRHAMAHATEDSVLGDFANAQFEYYGVKSRFFKNDGKFYVETDGPNGAIDTFQIKYTFGIDPLQQYLIEFPDGRLQALSIAWDARSKEAGGQRWFHLYPNENIRHDDVLHWTKLNQNWNFMCAECHSTGVRKNYDASTDRFATTWAEMTVGCEACHGQGSAHTAWAQAQRSWWPFGKSKDPMKGLLVRFDERKGVTWSLDVKTGNSTRSSAPATLRKEVETCGLCHARHGILTEDWKPGRSLSDTHVVSDLTRGLYSADGQMLDEVYNYGSLKQSEMYAKGVTCSDCHEPHSAKLRFPGDATCLKCHAADKYAAEQHHRHAGASPSLSCVSCHMSARTYMVVDPRHDHSFRIPRPDLSVKLGTPNACNDCHKGKTPEWAAAAVERWHGRDRKGFQNYAEAFSSAWKDRADADKLLAGVVSDRNAPAFARASALGELAVRPRSRASVELAREGLADPDPMVRIAALNVLEHLPTTQLWPVVSPLLGDANRGVRTRAVSVLAGVPTAQQPPADRESFDKAAAEFVAAQRLNADRPEGRVTLGSFYARRGQFNEAEVEYKAALRLSPQFVPAAINLADLYRQQKRDPEGTSILRELLATQPTDARLHYALGLTLTRLKQGNEALRAFRHATELDPDQTTYLFVYAIALHSAGQIKEAIDTLKEGLKRHEGNLQFIVALIKYTQEAGDLASALEYAERLKNLTPGDHELIKLIERLKQQVRTK